MVITNLVISFMFAVTLFTFGFGTIPALIVIGVLATFQDGIKPANVLVLATFIWLFISYGINIVPVLITIAIVSTYREETRISIAAAVIWGIFVLIYILTRFFSILHLTLGFILLLCIFVIGWAIWKFWKWIF